MIIYHIRFCIASCRFPKIHIQTQKTISVEMINDAQLHHERRKFSMEFPLETTTTVLRLATGGSTGDYGNFCYILRQKKRTKNEPYEGYERR